MSARFPLVCPSIPRPGSYLVLSAYLQGLPLHLPSPLVASRDSDSSTIDLDIRLPIVDSADQPAVMFIDPRTAGPIAPGATYFFDPLIVGSPFSSLPLPLAKMDSDDSFTYYLAAGLHELPRLLLFDPATRVVSGTLGSWTPLPDSLSMRYVARRSDGVEFSLTVVLAIESEPTVEVDSSFINPRTNEPIADGGTYTIQPIVFDENYESGLLPSARSADSEHTFRYFVSSSAGGFPPGLTFDASYSPSFGYCRLRRRASGILLLSL